MSRAQVFGWLVLLLVVVLNQVAAESVKRAGRPRLGLALLVLVPAFVGFALAQMGVQLLGGGA